MSASSGAPWSSCTSKNTTFARDCIDLHRDCCGAGCAAPGTAVLMRKTPKPSASTTGARLVRRAVQVRDALTEHEWPARTHDAPGERAQRRGGGQSTRDRRGDRGGETDARCRRFSARATPSPTMLSTIPSAMSTRTGSNFAPRRASASTSRGAAPAAGLTLRSASERTEREDERDPHADGEPHPDSAWAPR